MYLLCMAQEKRMGVAELRMHREGPGLAQQLACALCGLAEMELAEIEDAGTIAAEVEALLTRAEAADPASPEPQQVPRHEILAARPLHHCTAVCLHCGVARSPSMRCTLCFRLMDCNPFQYVDRGLGGFLADAHDPAYMTHALAYEGATANSGGG